MPKKISFSRLANADLVVDAIYEGGPWKNIKSEPISKVLACGNTGGFRPVGSIKNQQVKYMVLTSSLAEVDWPDRLDNETGIFSYYGDNRNPGTELHDPMGNVFLRDIFKWLHAGEREKVPPILVFTKAPGGYNQQFKGLAVPGVEGMTENEDLVAAWRSKKGQRFQNYRANFTVLDVLKVEQKWLKAISDGNPLLHAPKAWSNWASHGTVHALKAPSVSKVRSRDEQLPSNPKDKKLLGVLVKYFKDHHQKEYAFEPCAVAIAKLMDPHIVEWEMTQFTSDGGRDAVGQYRVGRDASAINVEFALEAKCKVSSSSSGVKETSRLISRLRHRQFGIFVTTSYLGDQAYHEIVEDKHPVMIITGADICKTLASAGYNTPDKLKEWLQVNF
jgi:hypothetical protein